MNVEKRKPVESGDLHSLFKTLIFNKIFFTEIKKKLFFFSLVCILIAYLKGLCRYMGRDRSYFRTTRFTEMI